RWYPIETIDHIGRWYLYGEVNASAAGLDLYDSEGQHELVELAEYVAQQLINDGWLENGLRPNSSPTVYG
ncbi:MAG: hypothetical protein NUV52_02240, partial [Candidatus Roizmanbacteria bacterium]|nr:hypothetical protein [Candidatus Roizmanbacteria bacterium]